MDDVFDPLQKLELALIRAEHQRKFQVMIAFIKEEVGEGIEYSNQIARAVVSENGAYVELTDLPEEFTGAAGDSLTHRFLTAKQAVALLTRAVHVVRTLDRERLRQATIIVLYTRTGIVDRKNCWVYNYQASDDLNGVKPMEVGKFLPGVMPLYFKIKLDGDLPTGTPELTRGIVFCLGKLGERNLAVTLSYDTEPFTDLATFADSPTIH